MLLLECMNAHAKGLRDLLAQSRPVATREVRDLAGARRAETEGYRAVVTSMSAPASAGPEHLPGWRQCREDRIRSFCELAAVLRVPMIAAADVATPDSLSQLVPEYEHAGVAGLWLHDELPCGSGGPHPVVPADQMVRTLRTAVAARHSSDFVIAIRTSSHYEMGIDGAMRRARLYRQAGADLVMIEASEPGAIIAIAQVLPNIPLAYCCPAGRDTLPIEPTRLQSLGYRLVIFPLTNSHPSTGTGRDN